MTLPPGYIGCGHGHVFPRADGVKARCGGPGICDACSIDKAWQEKFGTPVPTLCDTVFYRRADGEGTKVWRACTSRAEAEAQKVWCFRSLKPPPTIVWALDAGGVLIGEILLAEPKPSPSPPDRS